MRLGDYAEVVRKRVTAKEVANLLGLQPNSAGFCKCPIHGEKTGSMKLYPGSRGWYCFGCHTGGSVIDLVMTCCSMDLKTAIGYLNEQFQLGLPIGSKPTKEEEEAARRRAAQREKEKRQREEHERIRNEAFLRWCDIGAEIRQLEQGRADFAPMMTEADDEWDPRFCEALRRMGFLREEAVEQELIFLRKEVGE